MDNYELKPCPFCGGTKLKVDSRARGVGAFNKETGIHEEMVSITVRCNKCHARGPTVAMKVSWGEANTERMRNAAEAM